MTLGYSSSPSNSYDYVQDTEPADPEEGETWYSYAEDEARVYDGSAWQNQTVTDHGELKNVSVDDHFGAGEALAFGSGLLNLVYGDPLTVSGDTLGLDTVAPLTLSNGSLAVALGNALAVDGSDNLAVQEGDISHDNLAGVSASDHHTRYSDDEARTAVDGSNVSVDHDNLTGVGTSDHHTRYSDSEARSAVDGSSVTVDHDNLSGVSAGQHFGAGDALAFGGGLLNLVYGDPLAVSGDTLGLDTVAPLTLSNGSLAVALGNALAVDGNDNLAVQEGDISHDNLAGVSASDHHTRYSDDEARTAVDGSNVSVDHDNLTGVSVSDHFGAGDALAFGGGLLNLVYGDPLAVSGDTLGLDTVAPLTLSGGSLAVALGNALAVDGSDNLAVQEGDISHDNLAGVSASDHHSRYSDDEARTAVDGSNVSVDHGNLTGVGSSDHHSRYSDDEARDAVDGSNVSVDHGNLTGVGSSDHHTRYSDGEARTAVDGSNVDIGGDADTVDGQHAGDLGANVVQVSASDGTTHSGLSGDGDTLETFAVGSVSGGGATMFYVRISATGQTESGSGGYPSIGIRWVDSGGSEITRVDTTNWAGSSPRRNDPDGVIQFDETSNVTYTADFSGPSAAPIASGTVTAEVFDAGGGGGSSDTLASIDSILSTIVEF